MPDVDDLEDYLRYFRRSHIYLVGVANRRKKSIDDVSQTIRAVRPDAIIAELCEQRKSILTKEYSELRAAHALFESVLGVGYRLLLSTMDVRKRLESAGFDEPWKLYDDDLQQREFEKALDGVYQRAMQRWWQVILESGTCTN
ncbi:Protein F38A5.2 a, partial [Aphelenchoides avenae]